MKKIKIEINLKIILFLGLIGMVKIGKTYIYYFKLKNN